MTADLPAPGRPVWLTTLADLGLLLIGFFVFLQAHQVDRDTLAAGLRAGFAPEAEPPQRELPLALATLDGFAPGAAALPPARHVIAWAREAARDPRTRITITGEATGEGADRDAATQSGPILAADRARAVAALLVRSGAVAPGRLVLATGAGARRVTLTIGYSGGDPDARQ